MTAFVKSALLCSMIADFLSFYMPMLHRQNGLTSNKVCVLWHGMLATNALTKARYGGER